MTHTPALRVLHVVGAMDRAGVETWLMNLARNVDPSDIEFTFLKHSPAPSAYDEEIAALGHKIAMVPLSRNPLRYAITLARLVGREAPPFDVVHAHVAHFSALPIMVAWFARVPRRIAHSHSDNRGAQRRAPLARRAYFALTSAAIRWCSTMGLASSEGACQSLFRREASAHGRYRVLPTGIDLSHFPGNGEALRAQWGLGTSSILIGHVGRFVAVKNQAFLLEVAQEWIELGEDVHLALVGDGPLREELEAAFLRTPAADRVHFLGVRDDVPDLLAAFNLLLLPSLYEGVPVALLEAQASGCPALVSDHVGTAVDVVPGLISRLSIDGTARDWAVESVRLARAERPVEDRRLALEAVESSAYNVTITLATLRALWADGRQAT